MAREKAGFSMECNWCGSLDVSLELSLTENSVICELKCEDADCQETTHIVKFLDDIQLSQINK